MGTELEFKLHIDSPEQLAQVLRDPELNRLCSGVWQERRMYSLYYDTPDRQLRARRWTLRFRQEGARPVVCLKLPTETPTLRRELELEAPELNAASLAALVELGAPAELLSLREKLTVICGAEFVRHSAMLTLPDGTAVEVAGDNGMLCGRVQRCAFTELELELHGGRVEQMRALTERLCACYALHEEPRSKFARASALE